MKLSTQTLPKSLNPWNWFKHEEEQQSASVPVHNRELNTLTNADWPTSFLKLHQEMDRLFDDAFRAFGMPSRQSLFNHDASSLSSWQKLSVDVVGDDHQYDIRLDVPGVKESDIDIELQDRLLTVKAKMQYEETQNDKQLYRSERHLGEYQRTFSLPDDALASDIRAQLKDGVLHLEIPRQELPHRDVKRIEIQKS